MRKSNRIAALVLAGVMAVSMAACQKAPAEPSQEASASTEVTKETQEKAYKIGVLQLVQHPALDKTNKGFVAALAAAGVKVEYDQQNAAGDQSACQTIATTLANNDNDLIFAIATNAAQAAAGATDTIPILLSAVTDPAASGLVESNEHPGGNVSGTSDLTPVKEQIALLLGIVPEAKTVGLLYCSAESNSEFQIEMAKEALETAGIAYKDYSVAASSEITTVVSSMVGNVDAIYAPTDNMIAAGMTAVATVANENKIPVICGESGMVESGGLATYGIDYYQLGYMAGEQAVEILTKGADISSMPIGYMDASKCELMVNEETAKELGIDPASIK